ncbi:HIT family protein [Streptomonospora litoralis]|uniref:HIT domain protein n=1 Tax=Streptomonospora litoralis TaxID=2498135 RepID=A0A4P6Q7R1_9ACTN|nr:HIT domain-containing protein [Streptomonospora litoralis]QBI56838.1 HIT domain protein [Streptomonospora litoralis]
MPTYTKRDLPERGGIGPLCYDACLDQAPEGHDLCPGELLFFQCACRCHTDHAPPCVFCAILAGDEPATIVREWKDAIAFTPLNPVVEGHTLVIPRVHVDSAATDPDIAAATMRRAVQLAAEAEHSNILTSIGKPATQSVFHLHVHVVPRRAGDGLMLPWGTTGNPHDPHWCHPAETAHNQAERYHTAWESARRRAARARADLRFAIEGDDEDAQTIRRQERERCARYLQDNVLGAGPGTDALANGMRALPDTEDPA